MGTDLSVLKTMTPDVVFVRQKVYIVASNPVVITIDTEELDSGI
jgi:hypothetical protein